MDKYRIIVDSCFDYNDNLFNEKSEFFRVPFGININDENIIDYRLNTDDLIVKMKNSKGKILTAAPSPQDFINNFSEDKINFVITISSKLSGSYSSAILARNCYLDDHKNSVIYVIDSLSAACGENLLAYKLKLLLDNGASPEDAYKEICDIRDNMDTFFILDNFDVLIKNGRISNIKSFIIDLLNITPIMCGDNGSIKTYKKFRGKNKAYKYLIDLISEKVISKGKNILMITHCAALDVAKKIKEELNKIVPNLKIMLLKAGGLSSVYANEGGLVFAI